MRRAAALAAGTALCLLAACGDDASAAPGTLLDEAPVTLDGGVDARRIRYASVDVRGDASEVTGLVALPAGEAPAGGWPVVAVAHATTGVADDCAPSRDPRLADVGAQLVALAALGYVAVATDYEGLGTDGPHPYLHGGSAARAVADSVRAARDLVPDAGSRWAVIGHSQGGHAALFTAQDARAVAPELELVGAVAVAPVTDLAGLLTRPGIGRALLAPLVAVGVVAANPDAEAADVVAPSAVDVVEAAAAGCSAERDGEAILRTDAPLVAGYLEANTPGQAPASAPVLVLQGGRDPLTTPAATRAAVERLCAQGGVVALREYPRADHATVVAAGAADAARWLADRFAGVPAPSTC